MQNSAARNQDDSKLILNDFLHNFLARYSPARVWIVAIVFHTFIYLAVGFVMIALFYDAPIAEVCFPFDPQASHPFQPICDPAELVNGINVWIFFIPGAWLLYRWLPSYSYFIAHQLEKAGIIVSDQRKSNGVTPLTNLLNHNLERPIIYWLAIIASIISTGYLLAVNIPSQAANNPLINFWYYKPSATIIFIILYMTNNYVIWIVFLRVIITANTITSFFKKPGAINILYPLHPDKAGGLGILGTLTIRFALVAVFGAIWNIALAFYPVLSGGEFLLNNVIAINVLYILVLPFLLFLPLWEPHRAMVTYKHDRLQVISHELLKISDESLDSISSEQAANLEGKIKKSKELEEMYNLWDRQMPVWPISFNALRGFSLVASSPILLGFLPYLLDLLFQTVLGNNSQ